MEKNENYPNGLWYINKETRRLKYDEQNKQIYSKDERKIYYDLNYTKEARWNNRHHGTDYNYLCKYGPM